MTHYQLAKRAGVAPGMVSRFIKGERMPSAETIDRLAAALGLVLTLRPDDES